MGELLKLEILNDYNNKNNINNNYNNIKKFNLKT